MKNSIKRFAVVTFTSLALLMVILTGCSKENSLEPTPEFSSSIQASDDVAESVAGAVGEESGGVMDHVSDVFDLTTSFRLGKAEGDGFLDHREATYDETTGFWTLVVQRERGAAGEIPYGYWDRTFTYQFLNAAGDVQQYFVTEGDTARTINYNIVKGDGYFKNYRVTHDLKEIQGSFIATNANEELVTVNGTYTRAAVDTITTESFTRISDHIMNLTVTDLVGPKGSRRDLAQKVSGTITGTFHADIVFDGERGYAEKTVDREVNIVIGSGEAEISVDGHRYRSNIQTGQRKN